MSRLHWVVVSVFVAGLAVFSPCLATVAYGAGGGSTVVHVWADAPGGQTGADWQNAFHTIDQAVAAAGASAYEQMWVAGSLSHSELLESWARETDILVLGGFSGTENAPEERAAGAFSTIDGGNAAPAFQFENTAGTITFRDFAFTRTKRGALRKTGGAGHVCVTNCLFYGNRSNAGNATGNCLHLVGASGQQAEVSVSGCRLEGNAVDAYDAAIAVTIYANTLKRLTLDSCTFVTNTASIKCPTGNQCPGRDTLKGSEIYAIAAPVTARNCKFLVNRGCTRNANGAGGNIRLEGLSAPSAFTNCLFAGNSCQYSWRDWDGSSLNTTNMSGTVLVDLANASDTVDFANCTFAYNVTAGRCAPGALEVNKGCVNVVNSIFYGNVKATQSTAGRDIDAQPGQASVTVSYSAFEGLGSDFLTGPITIGEGVFACNPLFVTPYATVSAVITTSSSDIGCVYYQNTAAAVGVLSALDLHLRSVAGYSLNDGTRTMDSEVTSPAIDKGDPASPWEKEPDPNGSRVNLGFYGNTTEASATLESDKPSLSPDDVAVDFPDGYSMPVVSFALSGGDTAKFEATVIVEFITNGLVLATQTTEGVVKGQLVTSKTSFGLIAGDTLTVRVTAKTDGNDDVVVEKSVVVTGVLPPGQGKGGGSKVVHVWAEAHGMQTGEDWLNAFHTIDQAVAAAGASAYEQMWVAGSLSHSELLESWARETDILVLGGFSGAENAPEERAAGALSTIDGGNAAPAFQFANTAGTITFRDFAFTRTRTGALRKTGGAGHVCVTNCLFYGNRSNAGNATGNCLHLVGASGQQAEVSVSGCRLEGNAVDAYDVAIAVTIYANTLKRLTLDSCTFVTNTASIKCPTAQSCPGRDGLKGSEIYAIAAPVTARNCKFLVNRGCTRDANRAGGNIRLEGLSAPSAFTNCLFAGNSCQYSWREYEYFENTTNMTGTVLVDLANASDTVDFANCTFAYNVTAGRCAPGALEVNKGCVNVVNSIFYGNVKATQSTAGRDIDAQVGQASVTVSYSAFEGLGSDFLTGPITIGEGVFACNPLFVTPYATVSAVIDNTSDYGVVFYKNTDAAVGVLSALNLHLRGRQGYTDELTGERVKYRRETSPAIDKGNPASRWEKEPAPNGRRVNLGFYGNTPYATCSDPGLFLMVR